MTSQVLTQWLHSQPGGYQQAAKRAGLVPARPVAAPRQGRRSYAAAQVTRLTEGWTTSSLSANADIHASLDALRARSRQLARDNPYAAKFLQLVDTNVVGATGFALQARVYDPNRKPDTLANQAIESAFARWAGGPGVPGLCDATRRNTLRGLCRTGVLAAARDGELLFRFVRGAAARNSFGLALQQLDVDRIDTSLNRAPQMGHGPIRMGVELDGLGGMAALWLRATHPGETYATGSDVRQGQHIRLPAEDVIHAFISDRPEQVRGVPWMHAGMVTTNNLDGYSEAAIVAARVGASKMGFFSTDTGDPATMADEQLAETGDLMTDAEAGAFGHLPPGTTFTPFNPDYPSAMFADFVKANLRAVASAWGVAYHALANDLEGVSFSSIRSGTLEERDRWMGLQEWFVEHVLERVYAEWLASALAFGQITLPNGSPLPLAKLEKFSGHLFIGRRWEWVDPLRDIQADIAAVDAGLQSPQRVAAKLGRDYEDLLDELEQAAQMRAQRKNLQPAAPAAPAAKPGQPAAHAEQADEPPHTDTPVTA